MPLKDFSAFKRVIRCQTIQWRTHHTIEAVALGTDYIVIIMIANVDKNRVVAAVFVEKTRTRLEITCLIRCQNVVKMSGQFGSCQHGILIFAQSFSSDD